MEISADQNRGNRGERLNQDQQSAKPAHTAQALPLLQDDEIRKARDAPHCA
jgi:hypothetical protein